ncbi:uncharacterized protein LOC122654745 isoform X2 [Telopea speciosissima]|uniref:uncharacterized protein LOC122654745 isoform X1 n=1 Tax=Telopea speciosissima TaxID=54955 RepID=UPI001CC7F74A|nr:uncharacterized protein LOC122654745 isoform X1 [Telopea speciosissima]XP_043704911.1 uncharacterized protein LOC122654745 isoform X2 [Telopea speciosissima]
MACLSCSIEMEPRTLNQGELNNAREAAVVIVSNMEPQKASNVFIEGHRQVVPLNRTEEMPKKRDDIHTTVDNKESALVIERSCECSCTSTSIDESPEIEKLREPLSAPF